MNSLERVADGSLSLHDYAFSPAALDAIALQRVYAALDLTRSRRTLYPSTSSSSWGRLQPSLRDVRAARPPADDRCSLRVGHVSGRRTLGAGPHLASLPLLGNSSSGGGSRRRLLRDRSRSCRSGFPSGASVNALRDAVSFPRLQHVRPVAVSVAWTVGCVGAFIGLASEPERVRADNSAAAPPAVTSRITSVAGVQRLGRFRQ